MRLARRILSLLWQTKGWWMISLGVMLLFIVLLIWFSPVASLPTVYAPR